jgi:tRNA dimethylallyltransferase
MSKVYDMLVIMGPTASGKTILAAHVAHLLNGEIISADSRQVYRDMNIGTGKDYSDYIVNGKKVPFHLIDIADPGTKYNVFEYQHDFIKVITDLQKRNIFPVVCGGSGMYVDSIISGYKLIQVPANEVLRQKLDTKSMEELIAILTSYKRLHNTSDIDSRKRIIRAIEIEEYYISNTPEKNCFPHLKTLIAGLKFDRESRRKRISLRLRQRIEGGMIDEVKQLLDSGVDSKTLIYYGLEYKYITLYLSGTLSYEEMLLSLETEIHRFAKRQMTWFRGMERRGIEIRWLDGYMPLEEKVDKVLEWLGQ